MSIQYSLYVASSSEADWLLRLVEDALGLDHARVREPDAVERTLVGRPAPGFHLNACAVDPRSAQVLAEWLGFLPRAMVVFRLQKDADPRDAFLRILSSTSALLAGQPGDLALLLDGEHVRVLRVNGRVVVHDDPRVFDAEALARLDCEYELGTVPRCP